MVLSTTFDNISVISWLSVLLVEETEIPKENHQPAISYRQTLSLISTVNLIIKLSIYLENRLEDKRLDKVF
jgi:hypothetical protein